MSNNNLFTMSVNEFVLFLKQNGISKFYFVFDQETQACKASHEILQPLADFLLADKRDYHQHEGVFCQLTPDTDILQGAFIHKTCRGQGAGGTRYWTYNTVEEYLRDGLRLSRGMTHKNALAGLWWGGGKGVIAKNPNINDSDPEVRASVFHDYGDLVTSIKGCYVTAEDVGTTPKDIENIFRHTRFVTCIPEALGGSGNPSFATARGVICGMEAAVEFLDGSTLAGKTVVVQGMGHVGESIIQLLVEAGAGKIIASDIREQVVANLKQKYHQENVEFIVTQRGDNSILQTPCDILAPCATGGILNSQTIPQIKAKIVCGAANNQLQNPIEDDLRLFANGIIYAPDFVVNRMGIVNCANEQYGYVNQDDFFERHLQKQWEHSVYQTILRILQESKNTQEPPGIAAVRLADELAQEEHPIFGHRGQQIIDSLTLNDWAK